MPGKIEFLTTDGSLHLFKLGRNWKRDLEVRVRPQGNGELLKLPFPADRDRLEVPGLDPDRHYEVRVSYRRPWHRVRHAPEELTVTPRTRGLRVIITGSGRSGTKTLAHFLDGLSFVDGEPVVARHEPLSEWVVPALADRDFELALLQQRGALHNVETAPYYSLYPQLLRADKVLLVIRDGRRVVQSGLNRNWYGNDNPWNRIKPAYEGTQFEKCCRLWRDANTEVAKVAHAVFRLEDLTADPAHLDAFCAAAGIVNRGRELPHSNRGKQPSTTFTEWTAEQERQFETICGGVMDRHYPGWRLDSSRG
ncbi:MAG TPA: hypothetical protein PLL30_09670 [Candidatus Krumholzibacteria bacterium]|nr:hypothetical protein [Candidatus Krumholzibacteria bacterium]HPD72031.1 hypothetical protein [Candidatus Krumholzibacteria bacterium]HRY41036.1 hypothetical protein [Candidatus Krumholzibacteria bacterium]